MALLLNPPKRRRKKRKKARRRKSTGRKRKTVRRKKVRRRNAAPRRKNARRRVVRRRRVTRRRNPARRRRTSSYRPRRRRRTRRRVTRRRRNPAALGLMRDMPQIIPLRIPVKGLPGKMLNGMVQSIAGGGVVLGGYASSGYAASKLMEMKWYQDAVAANPSGFVARWGKAVFYAGFAGVASGLAALLAPKRAKGMWALLAGAGSGVRAAVEVTRNLIPAQDAAGNVSVVHRLLPASQMGDYVQMNDYVQTEDYVQTDGMDYLAAGLGDDDADLDLGHVGVPGQNVLEVY
jgi:hypothetical protein